MKENLIEMIQSMADSNGIVSFEDPIMYYFSTTMPPSPIGAVRLSPTGTIWAYSQYGENPLDPRDGWYSLNEKNIEDGRLLRMITIRLLDITNQRKEAV